jgi:hypothetical protein
MLDLALHREHLARLKASVQNNYSLEDIPRFITEQTYLKGEKYSFKDHEFQEIIISDTSEEVNVAKCSQVGLSEVMTRWLLSVSYNFPSFNTILTFPFSGDAADFTRQRVDPIIKESPVFREAIDPDLNNSETKRILQSLIHFRGTNGKTAAISIPADMVVSDEVDRSDPHILTQYTSRLTHSIYKWRRNFSTPTVKGHGIDLLMQTSRRFKNLCKCNYCNHWFYPDFYKHVRIPGFIDDLKTLNKTTLFRTRYTEAKLHCPKCDMVPDLRPEHRQYVCENNDATFVAAGYYVSPFDAPAIITPVSLLKAMVSYARRSEFDNQNLGIVSEDASESLVLSDITGAEVITDLSSSNMHAMGCDMGLVCHIVIGRLTLEGQLLIVKRVKVPLERFEETRRKLAVQYRVGITVCDSQPYVDLILRMQRYDKNLYGGVFIDVKSLETYRIKMAPEEPEEGKLPIHQAQINRNTAFDELMGAFKNKEVAIQKEDDELDEEFQKHMLDMKRVQVFDKHNELVYTWVKSKTAVDHWHHATLYFFTACKLRGIMFRDVGLGIGSAVPAISTFKVRQAPTAVGAGVLGLIKRASERR